MAATLTSLPNELLESILLRCSLFTAASSTCRTLHSVANHPSVLKRWILQYIDQISPPTATTPHTKWNALLTQDPFIRLSELYRSSFTDAAENKFEVAALVRRAPVPSRVLGRRNGSLEALLNVLPPPDDGAVRVGGSAVYGGDMYWTVILHFAAFYGLTGAFEKCLAKLEQLMRHDKEVVRAIVADALEAAVMGSAMEVVQLIRGKGYGFGSTQAGRIAEWGAALKEQIEDGCGDSTERAAMVQCFLAACGNLRDESGLAVWDDLIPAAAGDAQVLRVLLARANPKCAPLSLLPSASIDKLHDIAIQHLFATIPATNVVLVVEYVARIATIANRPDILTRLSPYWTESTTKLTLRATHDLVLRLLRLALAGPGRDITSPETFTST
ncbi:hypothetical protein HK104_007469, partial [Borealophlyctis nickersoniae]